MLKVIHTNNGWFTKEGWGLRVTGKEYADYFEGDHSVTFGFTYIETTKLWLFVLGYRHWNPPHETEIIPLDKQQQIFDRMRQILPVVWEGNIEVGGREDFS